MTRATIIIPCFNESERLCFGSVIELLQASRYLSILFVNDGSSDNTVELLRTFKQKHDRVDLIDLPKNVGKAEAIRSGMLALLAKEHTEILGYVDADFATPVDEVLRLLNCLKNRPSLKVAFASRAVDDGARINRTPGRQLAARVFNVFARAILKRPVSDTQCGAKFFRQSELLRAAVSQPFKSNWSFDVELFCRLSVGQWAHGLESYKESDFMEMPLRVWNEIGDSRMTISDKPRMIFELARLWVDATRLRRQKPASEVRPLRNLCRTDPISPP
jgi:dolichyl-phosphate beta-glucosyltransferase